MSNAPTITRTALWAQIRTEGATQHIRIPLAVVTVTPEQAFLGLGA